MLDVLDEGDKDRSKTHKSAFDFQVIQSRRNKIKGEFFFAVVLPGYVHVARLFFFHAISFSPVYLYFC